MPVLDGLQATSRLRAANFVPPILALTANASAEQRDACLAAECTDHLAKPIAGNDLIARVAAAWQPVS
jgi:CheY-like chemotaxis protein